MSNFMGSAIIASQNQMRDSAQKAVNHYAWAAEDAAKDAANARGEAAHTRELLEKANAKIAAIENELTIEKQKNRELTEKLEDHFVVSEAVKEEMTARYKKLHAKFIELSGKNNCQTIPVEQ